MPPKRKQPKRLCTKSITQTVRTSNRQQPKRVCKESSITVSDNDVSMMTKRKQPRRLCKASTTTIVEDDLFMKLMEELNIDSFNALSDTSRVMSTYEERSRCCVAIKKSQTGVFRVYHCVQHKDCVFKVRFGRRRKDGKFIIKPKQSVFQHLVDENYNTIQEGTTWRKARAEKVNEYLAEAMTRKHDTFMKYGLTYSNLKMLNCMRGDELMEIAAEHKDPIPYNAALRAIKKAKAEYRTV